jgi:hypothetical protein
MTPKRHVDSPSQLLNILTTDNSRREARRYEYWLALVTLIPFGSGSQLFRWDLITISGWMRIDNAGGVVLAIVYRYEASGVDDLILNKHVETTMIFTHVLAH